MTHHQLSTSSNSQATSLEPVILAEDVHKWYGSFEVLRGANLSVRRGEVIVVMGPSGSGKSTFIRTFNGLEDFQQGRIIVNGIQLSRDPRTIKAVRRQTGMVFQQFDLFPHLTVLENVTLAPLTVRKFSKSQAEDLAAQLLERVGILEQAKKYPAQLSGGQQQRVAIARSLAMQPQILLFDEPTSALDPEMVGEVLDTIQSLARTGITLVVVTHEAGFARHVADRIAFLDGGVVVEEATPQEFFESPKEERTRQFLSHINGRSFS
jgi:general L-amino acid transport system ATP-binding protein